MTIEIIITGKHLLGSLYFMLPIQPSIVDCRHLMIQLNTTLYVTFGIKWLHLPNRGHPRRQYVTFGSEQCYDILSQYNHYNSWNSIQ